MSHAQGRIHPWDTLQIYDAQLIRLCYLIHQGFNEDRLPNRKRGKENPVNLFWRIHSFPMTLRWGKPALNQGVCNWFMPQFDLMVLSTPHQMLFISSKQRKQKLVQKLEAPLINLMRAVFLPISLSCLLGTRRVFVLSSLSIQLSHTAESMMTAFSKEYLPRDCNYSSFRRHKIYNTQVLQTRTSLQVYLMTESIIHLHWHDLGGVAKEKKESGSTPFQLVFPCSHRSYAFNFSLKRINTWVRRRNGPYFLYPATHLVAIRIVPAPGSDSLRASSPAVTQPDITSAMSKQNKEALLLMEIVAWDLKILTSPWLKNQAINRELDCINEVFLVIKW